MKQYNRVMLGKGGIFADQCKVDGYIGANFLIFEDLTNHLPEDLREFNKNMSPFI